MPLSTRRALFVLPLWLGCVIWMWSWWLQPDRINFMPLFIPLSLALFYEFAVLPTTFLYFVLKAKKPQRRQVLKNQKVAVISPCVPSKESIEIVEQQLKAMSEITYPHDSWILDEGNDKKIKALAKQYGVKYFSRKNKKKYNQPSHPFQAKTKAGNVNAWLDHVKKENYDFFVQLDIDHIPKPNYLHKTLGYFRDKKVAWVQAPSVYKNRSHWVARGAAEQELVLQGPLQMGFFGHSETPFIIGSHCTYRTSAVYEIGGFQPTRAEDHLDTVVLANKGYKGVFLPEIIAEGDGPETLNTYLAQQFAWAYSMFQVLLYHTPKLLKTMSLKRKWQFLFAQTWYPLWALSYLVMFMVPLIALLVNYEVGRVKSIDFLTHFVPLFMTSFLVWWAARPIMQPREVMLSWRGMILHAVRWPVILRAILGVCFNIKKPYMITPKGSYSKLVPTVKLYRPFIILGLMSTAAIFISFAIYKNDTPLGQVTFTLTNALFMLIICVIDLNISLRQAKPTLEDIRAIWMKPVGAVAILVISTAGALVTSYAFLNNAVFASLYNPATSQQIAPKKPSLDQIIEEVKSITATPPKQTSIGIYDEPNTHSLMTKPHIQHVFIDWNNPSMLAQSELQALESNNTLLATIEPRSEQDGNKLLEDITLGSYDAKLADLAKTVAASSQTIYIRFAHEMDLADVYPWGGQTPSSYIAAYRYVVNYMKIHGAGNIRWVWSPAGNYEAWSYYPGYDVVDVIGTTILYDQYWYGSYRPSFYEIAAPRSWLLEYGKPVWITELGIGNADPLFQEYLTKEAFSEYQTMGYSALIYLNTKDANIAGPVYTLRNKVSLKRYFEEILH